MPPWNVNYCAHNFWNRLQHAIMQWTVWLMYRGYKLVQMSLSFG